MKKIISVIAVIALVAVLGTLLVACAPADAKAAKEKLEKKDYAVVVVSDSIGGELALAIYGEHVKDMITATSKDGKDQVSAILFDSAANAKAFYKDNKELFENKGKDETVSVSGKWIIGGTKAGVKAFK